ncbi:MAG: hypothetical protein ABJL55_17585 [Roseibium sp.]
MVECAKEHAEPGDVLVFRWRDGSPAKHVGILSAAITENPHIIHAYERVGVTGGTVRIAVHCFLPIAPEA